MTEPPNDPLPDDTPVDAGYAEEPPETEAPRRSASAQLVVTSETGSAAMLREAMDPANQSLRDALRLSYRVLQFVMLVLVVLFVGSGFKVVEEGQTGVMLRWGKILGDRVLEPGPKFSKWPYPAGEFVLFEDQGRAVGLGDKYWPYVRPGSTLEGTLSAANAKRPLKPGPGERGDGYLLTSGGDIAHLKLNAIYEIDNPVDFVHAVEDRNADPEALDADRLVELALARAAVHAAASMELQELVQLDEIGKDRIRSTAQQMLTSLESGVRLQSIDSPLDPMPALAIKKSVDALQELREQLNQGRTRALEDARNRIIETIGVQPKAAPGEAPSPGPIELLEAYQTARAIGDPEKSEAALVALEAKLLAPTTTGRVSSILEEARAYGSQVEATLGYETRRFRGYLDTFRSNPDLLVSELWLDAYSAVLDGADTEVHFVPADIASYTLSIGGSQIVRDRRRDALVRQKEREAATAGLDIENPYIRRLDQINVSGPGRVLGRDARGTQPVEGDGEE